MKWHKPKHSRGPWHVEREEKGRITWYVKNGTDVIAKVYREDDARFIVWMFEQHECAK